MLCDSSENTFATADDSLNSCMIEPQQVAFGNIEIREYAMILGKGPSASGSGPSLEIDWEAHGNTVLAIEEYESMRYERRQKNELIMPSTYRRNLLLESGYTMREISEMETHKSNKGSLKKKLSKLLPSSNKK
eukprot:CAMPEP_0113622046 /NCGR_PEP_ID=MMETSP0017_2-20120614/11285_1 /TAXON_ID=2856 /ORGANISM="Cylindrotheca closterium" /LENGTH=132 /DNA_ID=CAMNT_0000531843 /DNA_START=66 /DNA_END=464 /DNA_ORIENTATION=- /assembly_acc=CAM_ASM_000147